jgi:hypothetical protein
MLYIQNSALGRNSKLICKKCKSSEIEMILEDIAIKLPFMFSIDPEQKAAIYQCNKCKRVIGRVEGAQRLEKEEEI